MSLPFLEVGALVRHRDMPEWGVGQIQSIVGERITVTFENEGKVVFRGGVNLDLVDTDHF